VAAGDRGAFALLYDRYCRQAYSLARRVCVDQEYEEIVDGLVPAGPGADEQALSGVISDQVRAALRQLTQEQRQVIALAYLGGYTQSEVSAVTGLPLGTVKSRTFEEIALRDHLPHCTACRGALSDAEDVVGLLGTIPAQHQPPQASGRDRPHAAGCSTVHSRHSAGGRAASSVPGPAGCRRGHRHRPGRVDDCARYPGGQPGAGVVDGKPLALTSFDVTPGSAGPQPLRWPVIADVLRPFAVIGTLTSGMSSSRLVA